MCGAGLHLHQHYPPRVAPKGDLWTGFDVLHNGKSSVAWSRVQRPLHLGGLGIMDLRLLGMALRAR
jgi:hypothetical protein